MIRNFICSFAAILVFATSCQAKPMVLNDDVSSGKYNLKPEPQHFIVSRLITGAIENYHYKNISLDDSLSSHIFNTYLKDLDKSKCYFLLQDIEDFEKYRYDIDNELQTGLLPAPYYIYNRYSQRLEERFDYALETLKSKKLKLESHDMFTIDREQKPWFKSKQELDNYWNQRLRYEIISQKLLSKKEKKAYQVIIKRYENMKNQISKLKSEDVFEVFMNAFTQTVEPHTTYLSPKTSSDFKIQMSKSLEGIGATLRQDNEYTKIVNLTKGGPAERSKQIFPNDKIVAVAQGKDGEYEDVVGWRIDDVVQKVRGPKGTMVRLHILSASGAANSAPKQVNIIRDKIILEDQKTQHKLDTIKYAEKEYKIGIITIPDFYIDWDAMRKGDKNYNTTTGDVKKAIIDLNNKGSEGILIDLRNNGGGSLKEAIDLTGLFIPSGPVVQVRDAKGKIEVQKDPVKDAFYTGPLTVLVNRFSASASEIFAAAMQDYGRAVIIGQQTYGKGTVQNVISISDLIGEKDKDLGQLNITMGKFYRISGGSTQHRGVIPDISFPSKFSAKDYGESSQPTALPWDQINPVTYKPTSDYSNIIPRLIKDHEERDSKNPEYKYLLEDIAEFENNKNQKTVQLSETKMKKERQEKENEAFLRYNKRRVILNLPQIKKGSDRPPLNMDYIMDESLKSTAELVDILSLKQ